MNDHSMVLDEDEDRAPLVAVGAVGAIVKSEVEAQLDAAHRYPRSIRRFLQDAISLATNTQETAESCIYTLKRREANGEMKLISGPSVRLAELAGSAYGNLHYGARIIEEGDKTITAQGVAWDLEKNLRASVECQRRITTKTGRRYSDDMVVVTGNAACSIALRNAIYRVVPRSYVDQIFTKVKEVAVGNAQTLSARRAVVLDRLQKIGVSLDRVFAALQVRGPEDIGLEQLEVLIGLGTSIKNGESQIDDVFPLPSTPAPAAPSDDGRRIKMPKRDEPVAPPEPGSDG